jgi:plastocyanin
MYLLLLRPVVPALTEALSRTARLGPLASKLTLACLLTAAAPSGAGDLRARVVDREGKPLTDAIVVAKPLTGGGPAQGRPTDEVLEQLDKEFVPRVKPIFVGSRVRFPNHDSVRHQVYSFSPAKKFDLPLYSGGAAPTVVFDAPGIVALGCNIHDWMVGYIYVSETPYFAQTGKDGTALIQDLPAGDYNVRVWQPSMGESEDATLRRITVSRSGPVDAEWRIILKPAFKIRRAPGPGGGAYR